VTLRKVTNASEQLAQISNSDTQPVDIVLVGRPGLEPGTYGLKEHSICERGREVGSVCDPNGALLEAAREILLAAAKGREVEWAVAEALARGWLARTAGALALRVLAEGEHAGTALVEMCARIVEMAEPAVADAVEAGREP